MYKIKDGSRTIKKKQKPKHFLLPALIQWLYIYVQTLPDSISCPNYHYYLLSDWARPLHVMLNIRTLSPSLASAAEITELLKPHRGQ